MDANRKVKLTIFLGCLTALAPLATDMYLPALPSMNAEFNVGTSLIQMTLSATIVGMALGQIFAGPISDICGRKIPLAVGMFLFALASAGCIFSSDIKIFLIFRLIQGLSGAFGLVIARAIARDCTSGAELTKFFSLLMTVNGLAPILSPVIGGQILVFADWRAVFVLLTIIGAALTISSIKFDETLPKNFRAKNLMAGLKNFGYLTRDKYFLGHCLLQCAWFAVFFSYISGSAFLFQNIYGVTPQTYSLIFGGLSCSLVVAGVVPMRLAGKIPELKMLAWAVCQAFVGEIFFLFCVIFQASIEMVIFSLLVMIPMGSILGATSFSLSMRNHGKEAGAASAFLGCFPMLAGGLMSPLVGIAGNQNALPMAIIFLIGGTLALIIFWKIIWTVHQRGAKFLL
ncbi:MAG: multidrug effflux MFS transporter, partial [Selenomonadaceae bacterium]|nr:multidrug effflux MFS transporter [Selenomonadaceae bacterium]